MYELAEYAQRLRLKAAQFRTGAPEPRDWPAGLLDFVPALTPRWERPVHLARVAEAFERATREETRICISVPSQHGKTELVKHGLVWLLLQRPALRNAYVTYSIERAQRVSRPLRMLAQHAGLAPGGTLSQWTVEGGGCVTMTGIGGALTGEPIDGLLVIDDPHKDRRDAESATVRQHVRDWYNSVAEPRVHPGASVIVVHTRWHPDDLIGQLKAEGWETLNLPAIAGEDDAPRQPGELLWPSQRPQKWLDAKRANSEYDWWSLYQGRPRPRGGALFGEPHYYTELPTSGFASAFGVDLAYTAKTRADWSVCLRLLRKGDDYYVVDVQRKQVDAPAFLLTLKAMHAEHPARLVWHASGTEKGAAQFIQKKLPALETKQATVDKFVRAQGVAAAWNAEHVLLPERAPWLASFISEVCAFTGVNDLHDDQVDALASAHHACTRQRVDPRTVWGRGIMPRRM